MSDKEETLDYKSLDYLIQVLTALGQMDHLKRCKNSDCKMDPPGGTMSMKLEKRQELITKGWKLAEELGWPNVRTDIKKI